MNIVVCIKHVPDSSGTRGFEQDHTVDRQAADGVLNELDEYAVEQALRIRESQPEGTQVIALTAGPRQAEAAVRKALQMGADRGIQVLDDAVAGSDALATSLVLATAAATPVGCRNWACPFDLGR